MKKEESKRRKKIDKYIKKLHKALYGEDVEVGGCMDSHLDAKHINKSVITITYDAYTKGKR